MVTASGILNAVLQGCPDSSCRLLLRDAANGVPENKRGCPKRTAPVFHIGSFSLGSRCYG